MIFERTTKFVLSVAVVGAMLITSAVSAHADTTHTSTTKEIISPVSEIVLSVTNADGGVYWRSNPDWNSPIVDPGHGVYSGDQVAIECIATTTGGTVPPLWNNSLWYQVRVISGRDQGGRGLLNDHFLVTGVNEPNQILQGVPDCSAPTGAGSITSLNQHADNPCILRYPTGSQQTVSVFGGAETRYDRQASLYQVCEGFGAPEGLVLSPSMQCALIAAAATYGGPVVNAGVSWGCELGSVHADFESGQWLSAVPSVACDFFGGIFAEGVGIFAAGAASATGPGAVAVGVNTYRALAASLKVACGGLFDGGANALGQKLQADHETHIAIDVVRHGRCIHYRQVFGQIFWSAASCL